MISAVSREVESTASTQQVAQILQSRPLSDMVSPLLQADAKSYTTATDFVTRNSTFFTTTISRPEYTPTTPEIPISSLHTASAALTLIPPIHWTTQTHKSNITSYDGASALNETPSEALDAESRVAADKSFKKELYHYLRWTLSASAPGPGIPETMAILGREETLRRLDEARELTRDITGSVSPVAARLLKEKGLQAKEPREKDTDWMGSLAPR